MADGVQVRAATASDAEQIVDLHVRAWEWAYARLVPEPLLQAFTSVERRDRRLEAWRAALATPAPRSAWWVAERTGRVVGFVTTGPSRDEAAGAGTAELLTLYLDPEVVGQGIGRALMGHAVATMREQGYHDATLWVLENNARGRHFYEAAGWRPDGATKIEQGARGSLAEVRYRRSLDEA